MQRGTREYLVYRLLEIFPGLAVWLTFVAAIVVSVTFPVIAIYFIILFDVYWLMRISYLMIFIMVSWSHYRKAEKIDWQRVIEEKFDGTADKNWRDYWHIIFLPTYKEPYEIVAQSVSAIADSSYGNKKKIIVVVAGEERDSDNFSVVAGKIRKEYEIFFHSIVITVHPAGLPGELPGKGSNLYHAGHEAKKHIDAEGIDYKEIIVSTLDIDTIVHPQYFSHLTHEFLTHPNPYHASFQPLTFYHNNIWESDMVTRVVASSTTFWLLTDLARSDRLFTFSSHSMSWQALVDIGFWQNNIVTEDSRIFLQCLLRYDGDYEVSPLYIPVSMNTVYMGARWRSLINQYKQMRRWAYGVEHFPYMVWHFTGNKRISLKKKITYIWNQTEGVYSWATAPIIMFVVGRLPLLAADFSRSDSFIIQQAPLILSAAMTVAMWGVICIAVMSTIALPRKHGGRRGSFFEYLLMVFQWVLFPVTMILFGALPAIDAQTRLMLGRYLDFWVTEKKQVQSIPTHNIGMTANKIS